MTTKALTRRSPGAIAGHTFNDHGEFHGDVVRAVAGGTAGALLAGLIAEMGAVSFPLLVLFVVSGALAMVAGRGQNWLRAAGGAGLGLLGGILHWSCAGAWPLFGALLLGAAAGPVLARGETPARMAVTGVVTGVLTFGGLYVAQVMQARGILNGIMPAPLATAVAGSALGLFLGLGSAPRHVVPADDPVETAYAAAIDQMSGELHEILGRALAIYRAVADDLRQRAMGPTETKLAERVSALSMRILEIARQCRGIERDLGQSPASELEGRIEALKRKAAAATDATARMTLIATIKNLDGQRRALESIGRGLERVVARLHANVVLLEKVRFSLVHAKSADAERSGTEGSALTDALEELSRELDATSMAVGEVFGEKNGAITADAELEAEIAALAAAPAARALPAPEAAISLELPPLDEAVPAKKEEEDPS